MGKYEFKAIYVNGGGHLSDRVSNRDVDNLNEWFMKGWEYVETLPQRIAGAGDSSYAKVAPTVVIIKKDTGVTL